MSTAWKGSISFGLVYIPVALEVATREKSISFNQLHKECGSRVNYKKVCQVCNKEMMLGAFDTASGGCAAELSVKKQRAPGEHTDVTDVLFSVDQQAGYAFTKALGLDPAADPAPFFGVAEEPARRRRN